MLNTDLTGNIMKRKIPDNIMPSNTDVISSLHTSQVRMADHSQMYQTNQPSIFFFLYFPSQWWWGCY